MFDAANRVHRTTWDSDILGQPCTISWGTFCGRLLMICVKTDTQQITTDELIAVQSNEGC